jgi:3,4-dihydroxy 2-butanone 4-phosphate synthase/GTP cyclohydrolase II
MSLDALARVHRHEAISPTEDLIAEAQAGRMFILVDDEDRENEGDLIIPAQFATPQALAFMMRHARGLICLSLTGQQVERLGLAMMAVANNQMRHQTAFTVSIDARQGITTGVSARDRAHTIAMAINPQNTGADVVTPGHVFPLVARQGGTLIRAGHTEAAVDLARMAGLLPAGVICEIMNEDGSMARLPDLVAFAQRHGLKLGTIADLIAYRSRTEKYVRCVHETTADLDTGHWRVMVYDSTITPAEHIVMVKGDIGGGAPVLVRMQAMDPIQILPGGRTNLLMHAAMHAIEREGRGVMVVLHDWKEAGVLDFVTGRHAVGSMPERMLREYGIGAQILADLGVRDMVLLTNNPRPIVGLEGYGLNIVGNRPIPAAPRHVA